MKKTFIFFVFIVHTCYINAQSDTLFSHNLQQKRKQISMINLIANPEKYFKEIIMVEGFINIEFEGDAIYLHEEDFKKLITKNGFIVYFADNFFLKIN